LGFASPPQLAGHDMEWCYNDILRTDEIYRRILIIIKKCATWISRVVGTHTHTHTHTRALSSSVSRKNELCSRKINLP
jgi:hypothetical protein